MIKYTRTSEAAALLGSKEFTRFWMSFVAVHSHAVIIKTLLYRIMRIFARAPKTAALWGSKEFTWLWMSSSAVYDAAIDITAVLCRMEMFTSSPPIADPKLFIAADFDILRRHRGYRGGGRQNVRIRNQTGLLSLKEE